MKTTVVRFYSNPDSIYIGRAGKGQEGYFGNPFHMAREEDREGVIQKYREYFNKRIKEDPEFRVRVLALKGKKLGCFCAPKACHGDVIAEWLNQA